MLLFFFLNICNEWINILFKITKIPKHTIQLNLFKSSKTIYDTIIKLSLINHITYHIFMCRIIVIWPVFIFIVPTYRFLIDLLNMSLCTFQNVCKINTCDDCWREIIIKYREKKKKKQKITSPMWLSKNLFLIGLLVNSGKKVFCFYYAQI